MIIPPIFPLPPDVPPDSTLPCDNIKGFGRPVSPNTMKNIDNTISFSFSLNISLLSFYFSPVSYYNIYNNSTLLIVVQEVDINFETGLN